VVRSRDPFIINECVRGTGGACGAEYLNEAFEQLIRQKLGAKAKDILNPRSLSEAMRSFETTIKSQFDPLVTECEDEFEIPIPGAPELPDIGLSYGYLKLSKYVPIAMSFNDIRNEINSVFTPVFTKIVSLVQGQIQEVARSYDNGIKVHNLGIIVDSRLCFSSVDLGPMPTYFIICPGAFLSILNSSSQCMGTTGS